MSAQMIELLVLAVVAFLIISKLISILGTTDEDDPAAKTQSFFGEPGALKDVTGTVPEAANANSANGKVIEISSKLFEGDEQTKAIVAKIGEKIPNFDPGKFLRNSKTAINMIIEALGKQDTTALGELVDKRFINAVGSFADAYTKLDLEKLTISFKDAYSFGNSVYVKLLLKTPQLEESWVFTRNINQAGPAWYLSNIER